MQSFNLSNCVWGMAVSYEGGACRRTQLAKGNTSNGVAASLQHCLQIGSPVHTQLSPRYAVIMSAMLPEVSPDTSGKHTVPSPLPKGVKPRASEELRSLHEVDMSRRIDHEASASSFLEALPLFDSL